MREETFVAGLSQLLAVDVVEEAIELRLGVGPFRWGKGNSLLSSLLLRVGVGRLNLDDLRLDFLYLADVVNNAVAGGVCGVIVLCFEILIGLRKVGGVEEVGLLEGLPGEVGLVATAMVMALVLAKALALALILVLVLSGVVLAEVALDGGVFGLFLADALLLVGRVEWDVGVVVGWKGGLFLLGFIPFRQLYFR